ncbi:ATP synthase F0 subunit C [Anaerolineaceae bacterium oral taxon 439]|nr:ATP synthase F0 subunit C [Anaerolineaceae bacterium oral taxon 439]
MFEILNAGQIASLVSIIAVAFVMVGGTVAPTIMEGKIAVKAIEGISRQPDAAGTIRMSMIIGMALTETTNIYSLLIALILIFANPLLGRFFVGG